MMPVSRARNPFFRLVVLATVAFVVTILALVAAMLGDPAAPVNRLLDRYGGVLLAGEVVTIGLAGLLALVLDRWQTVQARQPPSADPPAGPPTEPARAPDDETQAERQ